ncbi:MAG: ABC transporter permease [Candidatus Andersenbacteria bacterium]|nr:ABC transporter permease [Candidatus Andersenbacteria bacterium]MBI3250866.1 ABC transporter permease [Candidatus Andersenbacteria bacterium]
MRLEVLYILWLRQLKRYIRSRARIIGSLGQPILFLVALGFGFGPIFEQAGGGNYIQFLAPGVIAMSILFTAMFSGIEVIWDRQFGFLKETLVAPVSRLDIMIGRTLGGATVSVIQGIIVLGITLIVGFRPTHLLLLPVSLGFMILIGVFFTALGTAIASKLQDMQGFQLIMNFLIMPTFFLSGALFPLEGLPGALSIITKLNPLAYGVDGLRGTLINQSHLGISTDFIVMGVLTAIVLWIGTYLFSKIEA